MRPVVEGTFYNIYDFRITPDFAQGRTVLQDAFITARFKPWAAVTVGKFKQQVGLERLVGDADTRFPERAFPTSLVPNRDLGVQVGGDVAGGLFTYSVAYTNGVTDGGSSDGNPTPDTESDAKGDVNARVFFQPFLSSDNFALRGLGFGIGGTYVDSTGSGTNTLLPSYRTPGQATFFSYRANTATTGNNATFADGQRLRYSPQFYYYYGSIGVLGEYAGGVAGRHARERRGDPQRPARQQSLAPAVQLAPDGRRGNVPHADSGDELSAGQAGRWRLGTGRAHPSALDRLGRVRGWRELLRAIAATAARKADRRRARPQLVPRTRTSSGSSATSRRASTAALRPGIGRMRRPISRASDCSSRFTNFLEHLIMSLKKWLSAAAAGRCTDNDLDATRRRHGNAAERLLRSDARAIRGVQRRVREVLERKRPART